MTFSLSCECGKSIAVLATAAGSEVACECGRSQSVPSLSVLRASTGRGEYETSAIDTIHRMIKSGELPGGGECVISGVPTSNIAIIQVECERAWGKSSGLDCSDRAMIGFLLFGWIGAIVGWVQKDKLPEERGRETYVDVPLRVSADHVSQLKKGSQASLKRLLRQVPIYDTLLEEYPEAVVVVTKSD